MRILPRLGRLPTEEQRGRCAYITTFYESPYYRVLHFIFAHTPENGFWMRVGNLAASPFDYADALWRRYYARHPEKEPSDRWFLGGN